MTHRAALAALFVLVASCAGVTMGDRPPPATVGQVDLSRYAGTWYEIARLPTSFQDGPNRRCEDVTATYIPRPDGTLSVVNRCRDAANGGQERVAEGIARPASPGSDRLRVSFFWPFFGDYWVIGLDPEYRWAVVGGPDRDYLWILSRTPDMPAGAYAAAREIARREGYDVSRLAITRQRAAPTRTQRFERLNLPRGALYSGGRA
ncbi:MAG TPA: lipocalin family protein [Acetobacteraceae bacterium]|nr:lipocalin family protein [Acetobacteraceae bacterium]